MANSFNLPDLGSNIDYGMVPDERLAQFNALRGHIDQLRTNYDILNRIRGGQVGPEITNFLGEIGPRGMQKAIRDDRLEFNVNYLKPYIGFTYRF